MKQIAIHGRDLSPDAILAAQELFSGLTERGVSIHVSRLFVDLNPELFVNYSFEIYRQLIDAAKFDLFISLGGDGTFLETLTHVGEFQVPILGINIGRLGFLSTIARDQITYAIDALFSERYSLDKRTLISLVSNVNLFNGANYALNEFAILRKETSTMIVIKVYINGSYLNSYWADGLMVSTPTGSTGYSLSCGGPILLPHTQNFVMTPVSPHNLNIRPLIVPDTSELTFEIESRNKSFLISLDSRSQTGDESINLKVKKASFYANLIKIEGDNFIDTLRNKLSWGLDKRN